MAKHWDSFLSYCMFPSSFSTDSRHIQHTLGWTHLIIELIAPPGTQVRQLVIFKL